MSIETVFSNPSSFISKVRHESEKSRYALALCGIAPIIIALIWITIETEGGALIFVGIYGLLIWFLLWFIGKVVKAALLMNLVEVNAKNFSKIHRMIDSAKTTLKYENKISAYVWSGSQVGLIVLHHLDRKIFLIESELLKDNPKDEVLNFSIMFHVARLKTKSEYFSLLTKIISGIEKLWFLNILLCPFERATVYTADRIAMIYSGKSDYAQQVFSREMVGTELGANVNIEAIAEQGVQCTGFFAWLARAYSPFPGYSHRFVELNKFSQSESNLMMERHQP
jgi:hypothetical protein